LVTKTLYSDEKSPRAVSGGAQSLVEHRSESFESGRGLNDLQIVTTKISLPDGAAIIWGKAEKLTTSTVHRVLDSIASKLEYSWIVIDLARNEVCLLNDLGEFQSEICTHMSWAESREMSITLIGVPWSAKRLPLPINKVRLPTSIESVLLNVAAEQLIGTFNRQSQGDYRQFMLSEIAYQLMNSLLLRASQSNLENNLLGVTAGHLRRIIHDINLNFTDYTYGMPRLAKNVGLSVRHINDLLSRTGENFSRRLWQLRLDLAYREITSPASRDRKIGDIAYASGFSDQAHFNRAFRKRFELTPTRARTRALQNCGAPVVSVSQINWALES
jgi:AraC-like DNA-binding protein